MQLPDSLTVGGTDRVDLNIAALTSHDGSSAFRILVTRSVSCARTPRARRSATPESSFSIRHTRNAKGRRAAARDALGLTFTYVDAFQVRGRALIQQTMTDAAFDALIDATFGKADAHATKRVRETERRRRFRAALALRRRRHPGLHPRHTRGPATRPSRSTSNHYARSAPRATKRPPAPPASSPATTATTDQAPAWTALTPA